MNNIEQFVGCALRNWEKDKLNFYKKSKKANDY